MRKLIFMSLMGCAIAFSACTDKKKTETEEIVEEMEAQGAEVKVKTEGDETKIKMETEEKEVKIKTEDGQTEVKVDDDSDS